MSSNDNPTARLQFLKQLYNNNMSSYEHFFLCSLFLGRHFQKDLVHFILRCNPSSSITWEDGNLTAEIVEDYVANQGTLLETGFHSWKVKILDVSNCLDL